MGEVLGAVIATALVLVAVFVPVAFFPGTTGRLYQQFALTIAFSVALSAFNALTLTPALSALLLDRREATTRAGSSAASNRVIDGGTHGYVRVAAARHARRAWAVVAACSSRCSALTYWVYTRGAAGVRARRGPGLLHRAWCRRRPARRSTTRRTSCKQAEQIMRERCPTIAGDVRGHAASASAARRRTRGIMFAQLKPFDERPRRRARRRRRCVGRLRGAARPDPGRDGRSVPAAVDPGPRPLRRLPVRAARPERRTDIDNARRGGAGS